MLARIDAVAAGEPDGPSPLDHHLRHLEQSTVRLSCVDVLADGDRDRCSGASNKPPGQDPRLVPGRWLVDDTGGKVSVRAE